MALRVALPRWTRRILRPSGALALALLALSSGGACTGIGSDAPGGARAWIEGPVRWLVLPDEAKRFRRLSTSAQVLAFIDDFWRRRDPDPASPANPVAQRFFERVQAADLLYTMEGKVGSMTDRGRAYILLGSPSVLRYTQRSAPRWEPGDGRGGHRPSTTDRVRIEVWGYQPEDLPERLREALAEDEEAYPVEVTFVEEERRTVLLSGEDLLERAARALVRE
jgi:GWxTD domain-containing protein